MFSADDKERYSRHFRLKDFGEKAQQKLKDARVLVVGAGGLGAPVLQYLTAAGIGTLGVVDDDTISLSNLQRQVIYRTEDVGKSKAETAARHLQKLNPGTIIHARNERIGHGNVERLVASYDIIVDTTDNIPARYILNDACVRNGKPLVYGAIFRWEGQVAVFNHNHGPTYRCLFPDPPGDMVLSCDEEGVVGVVPGLIGMYQATEVIKLITGTGEVLSGKLLTVDLRNHEVRTIKFSRNEKEAARAYENMDEIREVDIVQLDDLRKRPSVQLLDVRTREEFDKENIGGLLIPVGEMDKRLHEIMDFDEVLVVCQTGRRSLTAIRKLREAGYSGTCHNLTRGLAPYFSSVNTNP